MLRYLFTCSESLQAVSINYNRAYDEEEATTTVPSRSRLTVISRLEFFVRFLDFTTVQVLLCNMIPRASVTCKLQPLSTIHQEPFSLAAFIACRAPGERRRP